jgi:predicted lipoprotein with Yx(FWY)xxD motif
MISDAMRAERDGNRGRHRVPRPVLALAGVALVGLLAAACGSSTPSASPTTTKVAAGGSPGTTAPTAQVVANAMSNSTIGATILVNSAGMTLYQLSTDTATTSACTGACASAWPPLTVASGMTPKGGTGTDGTWGTLTRSDGTLQVTYKGHPLYTFAGDKSAGSTSGQNVKDGSGLWTVVTVGSTSAPATTVAPTPAKTTPTTTKPSSGGGYGY